MKKYESYKDSGIEWLGKIPNHWTAISMKFYFYMKGRIGWQGLKADEFISDGPYLVTGTDFDNGRVDWSRCYHISEERYAEAPEIHVKEGDLLITKDGTVGKLAYVDHIPGKVSLNSHLLILRPLTESVSNHFMYWALQADNFVHYTGLAQSGSIMASLSQEKIGNYKLALPSISEQRIIASYLDNRVSRIDTVIAEKEKMIEDLQSYRKSVISETVTRGLNPNVPMKDSGIEWIGMIPKQWDVSKLKTFAEVQTGSTPSTSVDRYWENPTEEWYTPSDFDDNDIRLKPSSRKLATIAFREDACRVFDANTVLIVGIGATLGKVGISAKPCSANQQINAVSFREKVLPMFGAYYLYAIKDAMKAAANAATLAIMNQSTTKDLPFVCPPYEEQRSIVKSIDIKTSKIANGIFDLQSQIEDLKSYKSSLITEAVTGKIDLRNE